MTTRDLYRMGLDYDPGPDPSRYAREDFEPDIEPNEELDFEKPLACPDYHRDVADHMAALQDPLKARGKSEHASPFAFASEAQRVEFQNARSGRRHRARGTLTESEWLAIRMAFGGQCAYCRAGLRIVLEHVRPISLGGKTEIENVVPACWACNTKKSTNSPEEFLGATRAAEFRERWRVALARARDTFQELPV